MKKIFFAPLTGAVVLGSPVYAGYCTYDTYHGVSESGLLLKSKVRTGYTYYDCGSCDRVYDEQGKGSTSKCLPK